MFDKKGPTFERLLTRFLLLISQCVFDCCVEKVGNLIKVGDLQQFQHNFKSTPGALYATDVTFSQAFRLSGSIDEGKG